jgi:hypothetical protein
MKPQHHAPSITLAFAAALLAALLLVPPGGTPARAGQLVGQTPADITYTNTTKVTCASISTALYAATTSPVEKVVKVPAAATAGVHVGVGAAATTDMILIEPGETWIGSGRQAVNCLRAGGSDVVTYLQRGSAGGWIP